MMKQKGTQAEAFIVVPEIEAVDNMSFYEGCHPHLTTVKLQLGNALHYSM